VVQAAGLVPLLVVLRGDVIFFRLAFLVVVRAVLVVVVPLGQP
jgi:hypothetical protein